jgi:Recombination endonuclease VII
MKKTCTKCGLSKDLSCFSNYKDKRGVQRKVSRCKPCRKEEYSQYMAKNPHKHRDYSYKKRYNITLEEYDALVEKQDGQCAICGSTESIGLNKRFVVDHNHETGEVRGLLCSTCNTGLGNFYDNPESLLKAAQYLYTNGYYGST